MYMTGDELRQAYLDFFEERGHLVLPSAPLVPEDDPSLLWINAGMAPFKPYFDGRKEPPKHRVATSQKCIRTNDIENVGKTARHQTFFEMLGNFSFGDYFKEKAITWAWEFVTEVINLNEDRLWITIYRDDEEAFRIWHEQVGVPEDRILRMGQEENFWQIGTGPCGPCSEIHYDRGAEYGDSEEDVVGGEGDRFLEIWNLVFTQYNLTENGEYKGLPNKNIDTGMGLERVASLLQDVESNFETDLVKPIIDRVEESTGIPYQRDENTLMAYRVIADHIRGITMPIAEGVLPSNEGRGYVLRRLLRRAVRFGEQLGYEQPFLYKLVPTVIDIMSGGYPELADREEHITSIIRAEEESFYETLSQGLNILNDMIAELEQENKQELPGNKAFKLYDTYGFPLDLTRDVLSDRGLTVDETGFENEMEKQRRRAREAREEAGFGKDRDQVYRQIKESTGVSEFVGYRQLELESRIKALVKDGKRVKSLKAGEEGEAVLERTPFYAESGGQLGDQGSLHSGENRATVIDTREQADLYLHHVRVETGTLETGDSIKARVTDERRRATARNHSATHLLHQALKEVLGDHVKQSGSLVAPDRLRFDFSHYSALSEEELSRVEDRVNQVILDNLPVKAIETTVDKARDLGATALFSEKYGNQVRVIKMGDFSIELCGGTHVNLTGDIGLFKIINESASAAGIRRIEAVTGKNTLKYIKDREEILQSTTEQLKVDPEDLPERISRLLDEQKQLEKEINSLTDRLAHYKSQSLLDQTRQVAGVNLLTARADDLDNQGLRNLADQLKDNLQSGIVVLAAAGDGRVIFVTEITNDLVEQGFHAGDMIARIASITGGGGGGRPDMAQAGGSQPEKVDRALAEAENIIRELSN